MPEYAEVETVASQLNETLAGAGIDRLEVVHPDWYVEGDPQLLSGLAVASVERWGKRLKIVSDRDVVLVSSLGMTGAWLLEAPEQHLMMVLRTTQGDAFYADPRRFGSAQVFLSEQHASRALGGRIGVDALEPMSTERLKSVMKASSGLALKVALLDQSRLSGIGNYLADEICFASGLDPRRSLDSLTDQEWRRVNRARRTVINRALKSQGASFSDYRHTDGGIGGMQNLMRVYGRPGQECVSCGQQIIKLELAGRGTHLCPHCQA